MFESCSTGKGGFRASPRELGPTPCLHDCATATTVGNGAVRPAGGCCRDESRQLAAAAPAAGSPREFLVNADAIERDESLGQGLGRDHGQSRRHGRGEVPRSHNEGGPIPVPRAGRRLRSGRRGRGNRLRHRKVSARFFRWSVRLFFLLMPLSAPMLFRTRSGSRRSSFEYGCPRTGVLRERPRSTACGPTCPPCASTPGRRKNGRQAAPVSTIPLNGEASESRPDASGRARRGSSRGVGRCGGQGSWRRSVRCCWSFAGPRG